VVAAYAYLSRDEVVEVGSIETYKGTVDLKAGDEANGTFSFERTLKTDYQVHVRYQVPYAGKRVQPVVHFKVWNATTGDQLFSETTLANYDKLIRLDPGEVGHYEFVWWVDADSGTSRVVYDVLVEPTEKLFE